MTATGGRVRRDPVYLGGVKVPGLQRRTTNDGRVVYDARKKIGGRMERTKLQAKTPSDARREMAAWVAKREAESRLLPLPDVTLRELRDEWEKWPRGPSSSYAVRTVEYYTNAYDRRVLRILGAETKAAAVRTPHLRAMIDKLSAEGLAGATVHGTMTATSALFRYAVRRGVIESNPTRGLDRGDKPSTKRLKEPRYLNRPEIDRLLARLGDEFRPVAAVMAFAGLRVSEALALRWCDIDIDGHTIAVHGTKTKASNAVVPMTADLAAELRAHRARYPGVGEVLVFRTATGQPQDRQNVGRALRAAGDAAKLNPAGVKKIAPHDLRHSCAALLLTAGVPTPKVAAIMRHTDARVTLTFYAGLVESERGSLRADLEAALQ
jgi:integrase